MDNDLLEMSMIVNDNTLNIITTSEIHRIIPKTYMYGGYIGYSAYINNILMDRHWIKVDQVYERTNAEAMSIQFALINIVPILQANPNITVVNIYNTRKECINGLNSHIFLWYKNEEKGYLRNSSGSTNISIAQSICMDIVQRIILLNIPVNLLSISKEKEWNNWTYGRFFSDKNHLDIDIDTDLSHWLRSSLYELLEMLEEQYETFLSENGKFRIKSTRYAQPKTKPFTIDKHMYMQSIDMKKYKELISNELWR
jgi:hypothetical protein